MDYRRLGDSGLKVSSLSIGGWLTFGKTVDDSTTGKILACAIERGVNFIDLADIYARGEAELAAGQFLSDYTRSDLVISSKVFWPMSENPNDAGLSRKHIMESVDKSLQRLRTDYLDIYFCHREDPNTPLEETAQAMNDLVQQGKILYWGTSVWEPVTLRKVWNVADRRNLIGPRVEQPPYSLLRRYIEKRVMPTAQKLGMGLVVWSPLAGGVLTGKYNAGVPDGSRATKGKELESTLTEENLERARKFSDLAQAAGHEPAQLALAWILTHPEVSSVITGATSVEQLDMNLGALDIEIDNDLKGRIEAIFPR